jgi:hypothetical protein
MLVRVSRNCPWNRCAFCPVYRGQTFSRRSVEEVVADLDAMLVHKGPNVRHVFLQDANPVALRPDDLVAILGALFERFPKVERVTAYARSKTLAKRSVEDLARIRAAGLSRIHVGFESGADEVLTLVDKGVTRAQQIEGGQRAKAAGFQLSWYVMPGLGGRALTDIHADETASAIALVEPHFVRLRSTAAIPGTPLAEMEASGAWRPLSEPGMVREIRRMLAGLEGVTTRLESDHVLNLLGELRGDLPEAREILLATCDRFLGFSADVQERAVLAIRAGLVHSLADLDRPQVQSSLDTLMDRLQAEGRSPRDLADRIRRSRL